MLQIPTADEVLEKMDNYWSDIINKHLNDAIASTQKDFILKAHLPDNLAEEMRPMGYAVKYFPNGAETCIEIVGTKK